MNTNDFTILNELAASIQRRDTAAKTIDLTRSAGDVRNAAKVFADAAGEAATLFEFLRRTGFDTRYPEEFTAAARGELVFPDELTD